MQYQFIDPQGAEGQHPADRNSLHDDLWDDSIGELLLLPSERMIQVAASADETWAQLLTFFGNLPAHVETIDVNHYLRATVFFDFEALLAHRSKAGLGILVLKQAGVPNSVLFHHFVETLRAGLVGGVEPDSLWDDFSDFGDAFDDKEPSWEARVYHVIRHASKPVPACEKQELLRILAVWSESSPQSRPAIARGFCSAAGICLTASSLLSDQESPSGDRAEPARNARHTTPAVAELYPLAVSIKHAASVKSEGVALRSLLPVLQQALAAPDTPELVARELLLARSELLQAEVGAGDWFS
eukprot:CAMPEP_0115075116 /NCGR_PEP_ID=MMETSP0227-20121206/15697_1 /TAXON_ID=89957 /ORGANISM="Polarella glacialis, Strain CCMP 1383" /LENGTH=299 /DNA_ID=CAMNT_0002462119 /DNA_START=72 /DNA_END=971 /DNA_ORIENTATION=+